MSPTRKQGAKVKSLPRKSLASSKAERVKGGQRQLPSPKPGTPPS